MVRYSFLVRLSHPLLHAGLSRRLLDHLIRPRQHVRRNRQADLFRGLQIDDELELRRLLHRQIGGLGAFQNFVHVDSRRADRGRRSPARRTSAHPLPQTLRPYTSPAVGSLSQAPRFVSFGRNDGTGDRRNRAGRCFSLRASKGALEIFGVGRDHLHRLELSIPTLRRGLSFFQGDVSDPDWPDSRGPQPGRPWEPLL